MQVTVEIELEQGGRIVGWPARVGTAGFGEAQGVQIEAGDEGVQEAHGVFGGDVILQPFGKEQRLGPVQSALMIHACH